MQLSNRFKTTALGMAVLSSLSLGLAMAEPFGGDNAGAPSLSTHDQPGSGQGGHHMGRKHRGDFKARREAFEKELGLTDAQKQQMKTQHEAFRKENAAAIDSMRARFKELRALDKTPENQQKRQQLIASLKQDRQALRAKRETLMQTVLTPDQMAKMKALKEQHRKEWQQRRTNKQQQAN